MKYERTKKIYAIFASVVKHFEWMLGLGDLFYSYFKGNKHVWLDLIAIHQRWWFIQINERECTNKKRTRRKNDDNNNKSWLDDGPRTGTQNQFDLLTVQLSDEYERTSKQTTIFLMWWMDGSLSKREMSAGNE